MTELIVVRTIKLSAALLLRPDARVGDCINVEIVPVWNEFLKRLDAGDVYAAVPGQLVVIVVEDSP